TEFDHRMAKSPVIFSDPEGDAASHRDLVDGTDNARDVFAVRLNRNSKDRYKPRSNEEREEWVGADFLSWRRQDDSQFFTTFARKIAREMAYRRHYRPRRSGRSGRAAMSASSLEVMYAG